MHVCGSINYVHVYTQPLLYRDKYIWRHLALKYLSVSFILPSFTWGRATVTWQFP